MAITYTEAKSTLDAIAIEITSAQRRLERAREQLASAESELTAMSTKYATFVADLNAEALAQNNALWDQAKAEKDAMVADFNALEARATALLAAYDAV